MCKSGYGCIEDVNEVVTTRNSLLQVLLLSPCGVMVFNNSFFCNGKYVIVKSFEELVFLTFFYKRRI